MKKHEDVIKPGQHGIHDRGKRVYVGMAGAQSKGANVAENEAHGASALKKIPMLEGLPDVFKDGCVT